MKHVVEVVHHFIRPSDVLVRYGGDEFVILLPETSLDSAKTLAERIRSSLEQKKYKDGEIEIAVGCSMGIGSFPHPNIKETDDLIRNVDQMLYESKKNGRNRISVYEPSLSV